MLNTNQKKPLYQQLFSQLRTVIENGRLKPGHKLPSERQLAADHGISRGTVRKAMRLLIRKGYAKSEQGSGTVVTHHRH